MNHSSSIQRVIRDVVDLCELQMQLLSVDSQAAKRELTRGVVFGVMAATLAGSALTVVLIGGGIFLSETTSLSAGGGLIVSGGLTFAIVLVLLIMALFAVRAAAAAVSETKSEFAENLRWLKATLISPESSPRNQIRRETFPEQDEQDVRDQPARRGREFDPRPVSPSYSR